LLLNQAYNWNTIQTFINPYCQGESFCKDGDGNINLWNVYNLSQ